MSEIMDSVWYGIKLVSFLPYKQIGIVAVKTIPANKVKFYIGLARGENVEEDEKRIAEHGVPFNPYFLFELANGIMEKVEGEKEGADGAETDRFA